MGEKGSALFLVLVLVVVLATLAGGLAIIIADEVEMSSLNETRIRARYQAEAGIERAYNEVLNDPNVSTDYLKNSINTEKYRITEVSLYDDPHNNSYRIYEITAVGEDGTISNEITVKIRVNRITQSTVTAGNEIYATEEVRVFGVVIVPGVEINGEQIELATNMPNFTFNPEDYVRMDEYGNILDKDGSIVIDSNGNRIASNEADCTGKIADWYVPNDREFEEKYATAFWNRWGTETILPSNEIVYVDGDLDLTNFAYSLKGGRNPDDPPAVVVVNGSVFIGDLLGNVENVIFIVKNDFKVLEGIGRLDDVLVYAGDDVEITAGGFVYNGMIISEDDTELKAIAGTVNYENVDMRLAFRALSDNNDPILPRIVYWD